MGVAIRLFLGEERHFGVINGEFGERFLATVLHEALPVLEVHLLAGRGSVLLKFNQRTLGLPVRNSVCGGFKTLDVRLRIRVTRMLD